MSDKLLALGYHGAQQPSHRTYYYVLVGSRDTSKAEKVIGALIHDYGADAADIEPIQIAVDSDSSKSAAAHSVGQEH